LRPEETGDNAFLFNLYASTRAEELKRLPWTDSQKTDFLRMQFDLQCAHYHQHYPEAAYQIIVSRDRPIGRLYVHREQDQILVIDIALLPEHRRAGLGGSLLRELQVEAAAEQKAVRIHVELENPALRLYTRLGFRVIENQGVYYFMEWNPKIESDVSRPA
jgi:ribosomal protein S18 acetylase RimI-like enzyme